MNNLIPPVIVIGMHRSGTTMVTEMLQRLGLFMGWMVQENMESLFFVRRNERLMNACGGSWEYPESVGTLLRHSEMRQNAVEMFRRDVNSYRFASYLGPARYLRGGVKGIDFPWGWKDPRNSFLLPLWLELFPEAKIIHICRHPMDVARSLSVRETRRVEERVARSRGPKNLPVGSKNSSKRSGLLLGGYRRLVAAQARMSGQARYARVGVRPTQALETGLRLWAAYEGACQAQLGQMSNPRLSLRYEDFLTHPAEELRRIADFCELTAEPENVQKMCSRVRADRAFAYRRDENAREVFNPFKENDLVQRYCYHKD